MSVQVRHLVEIINFFVGKRSTDTHEYVCIFIEVHTYMYRYVNILHRQKRYK
jgi:hypothetical protein